MPPTEPPAIPLPTQVKLPRTTTAYWYYVKKIQCCISFGQTDRNYIVSCCFYFNNHHADSESVLCVSVYLGGGVSACTVSTCGITVAMQTTDRLGPHGPAQNADEGSSTSILTVKI